MVTHSGWALVRRFDAIRDHHRAGVFLVSERGRDSQRPSIIFKRSVFQIFECWKSLAAQTSSSFIHSLRQYGGTDPEVPPAASLAGQVHTDQPPLVHAGDLNSA
jgi:hypothetical protein